MSIRNNDIDGVKDLNFKSAKLSKDYVNNLANALESCKVLDSITSLNLSETGLNGLMTEQLGGVISKLIKLEKLEKLDLSYNKLGRGHIEAFSKSWPQSLVTLNLSNCYLGDAGIIKLSNGLSCLVELKHLNLESNYIYDKSVPTLSVAISHMVKLESFVINGENEIAPVEAQTLFEALAKLSAINEINFLGNPIGDEGVSAFCKVLQQMENLTKLGLGNYISSKGFNDLAGVLVGLPPFQNASATLCDI